MIRTIIFDFFDVIRTDAFKAWLIKNEYKLEGKFLEVVQKMDHGQITTSQFLNEIGKVVDKTGEAVLEEMEENTKIDYEVLKIIESLRPKYKIGLLSNAPSEFIRGLLKDNDLEKYFDEIVISSEVGMIKPHAEIFELILFRLKSKPEETLFIDDSEHNVRGATGVGIKSIQFQNASQLERELKSLEL